ncbi:hypothetical protein LCGC14_0712690 [marine sediment metagenome]|uniref:Uncharacterized protein n=1 Tax=marine sediment metagenome TaxID=412755 RepID=A0A0F9TM67_9ZZZZ
MQNVIREYDTKRDIDVDESGDLIITGKKMLFGVNITNLDGSTLYVKLYNKATAPTVGTDTPKMTLAIPTLKMINLEWLGGIPFSLGIGVGATTGVADTDTTGPGVNECVTTFLYK